MSTEVSEIEVLYSPSKWSKRLPPETICQKHAELITKDSEKVRNNIPCLLDIPYGPNPRDKMDIFGIDLSNDSPIFVFVHGGYWQEAALTHSIQSFIAENLYKNGIKTICIGYELCPEVTLPVLMQNIERAVAKCVAYCKKNGSGGLHFAGHSAGAQLIAALHINYIKSLSPEDQKLFKNSFLVCGVYDLSPLLNTSYNVALKLDKETVTSTSSMHQNLHSSGTKFHVIAAENDSPAFVEQSKNFHERLLKSGLDSKYRLVDVVDHFDVIEKLSDRNFELTEYIINEIKKSV